VCGVCVCVFFFHMRRHTGRNAHDKHKYVSSSSYMYPPPPHMPRHTGRNAHDIEESRGKAWKKKDWFRVQWGGGGVGLHGQKKKFRTD